VALAPAKRRVSAGLVVFVCVAAAYAYFLHALPFTNAETRWALVRAIVEQHSLSIDAYHASIGDKALIKGHYYTDKAPGSSFLGVPFYAVLWYGSRVLGLTLSDPAAREMVRYLVVSLPSAALAWLLFRATRQSGCTTPWAAALALAYALGTPALPYSTLYYGHQTAALCVFGAFLLLTTNERTEDNELSAQRDALRTALAGFLGGAAILIEHPLLVLVGPLGLYVLFLQRPWWRAACFAAGVVPGVLAMLAYNWAVTGEPFTFPYRFEHTPEYRQEMAVGLYSVTHPRLSALWDLTFSLSRGLFIYSPFLLFAAPGIYLAARSTPRLRPVLLSGILGLVMILFNASIDSPWGGWSCGPRYLLPGLPFLAFSCYPAILATRAWWWRPVFAGLATLSVAKLVWATSVSPHLPEVIDNPVTEFWWPLAQAGVTTPSLGTWLGLDGAWSLMPLIALIAAALVLLFARREPGEEQESFTQVRKSTSSISGRLPAVVVGVLACVIAALPNLLPAHESIMKHTVRAVSLQMNGARDAAMHDFERILALYDLEDDEQGKPNFVRNALEAHVQLGEYRRAQGDYTAAEAHYRAAIEIAPSLANPRFALAIVLEAQRRPQEAVSSYREAFRRDERRLDIGQHLAWMLATHPEADVRNGSESVTIARALCEETNNLDPLMLDTLAAALAESGDYVAAAEQARAAVRLAAQLGDTNLARQINARLQSYGRGEPYHGD